MVIFCVRVPLINLNLTAVLDLMGSPKCFWPSAHPHFAFHFIIYSISLFPLESFQLFGKTVRSYPFSKMGKRIQYLIIGLFQYWIVCLNFSSSWSTYIIRAFENWYSPKQYGFVKCKSTVLNQATINHCILSAMDKGGQVDVVYTDFAKAIDEVPHSTLLEKLSRMASLVHYFDGLSLIWLKELNTCLFWVTNLLTLRWHPQGSHLGPILFNIFINDLPKRIINGKILLFADDAKFFIKVDEVSSSQSIWTHLKIGTMIITCLSMYPNVVLLDLLLNSPRSSTTTNSATPLYWSKQKYATLV